jgi:hypothetical protein
VSKCTEGKKKPDLKGKKPKYVCKRCGMKARRKGDLCKPKKA